MHNDAPIPGTLLLLLEDRVGGPDKKGAYTLTTNETFEDVRRRAREYFGVPVGLGLSPGIICVLVDDHEFWREPVRILEIPVPYSLEEHRRLLKFAREFILPRFGSGSTRAVFIGSFGSVLYYYDILITEHD
jgi:hypothetical protein